jgi:hypothetical protein
MIMRANLLIKYRSVSLAAALLFVAITSVAFAQGTAFTYQGKLNDSGSPANGQYDFQFKLFDTQTVGTGTQQGSTVAVSNLTVTAGIFSTQLDFGACASCFNSAPRFIEIAVKPTGGSTFTTLGPRQPITANPYAIRSLAAATADGLSVACINCVTSSQIASVNGSAVSGAIPVASVPSGSGNYIQNTTSPQATSDFNISGNGIAGGTFSANFINATMQFNLGGQRVLSAPGQNNLFAGLNAGTSNNGFNNAFFGAAAGFANTSGFQNAFFGNAAGHDNTSGGSNAFFGNAAGFNNTSGGGNAFFGISAGHDNTTGCCNAFFGESAGLRNTAGLNNTFIGNDADFDAFNPTGNNNTLLGSSSKVTSGISNATAIGALASVTQSNSLVLGSINGPNGATADTKVGIGTTAPAALLDVQRDGGSIPETARFNTFGTANEILSRLAGGSRAAPAATPNGTFLLQLGATGHNGLNFVASPGASIVMDTAEAWTISAQGTQIRFRTTPNGGTAANDIATRMIITNDGKVGIGNTAPVDKLHVSGDLRVGTGTTGCVKDANGTVIAGTCSSDARLKRAITPFPHLLDKVAQLQPVQFYWRAEEFKERHFGTKASFGLIAQEVEKVLPELVTEDGQGFKAVNYSKLPLLSLQAIKELKAENDQLKQQLSEQQQEMAAIKKLLCTSQPQADLCRAKSLK